MGPRVDLKASRYRGNHHICHPHTVVVLQTTWMVAVRQTCLLCWEEKTYQRKGSYLEEGHRTCPRDLLLHMGQHLPTKVRLEEVHCDEEGHTVHHAARVEGAVHYGHYECCNHRHNLLHRHHVNRRRDPCLLCLYRRRRRRDP